MTSSRRKQLLIGAGVLGVLIVALLIAPSFFNLEQYKPQLLAEVKKATGRDLVIDRSKEAHHFQISGDTGSGKSTLIRRILYQVEERGETAIVYDPHREYIQEFYNAARGDIILNPKDERCPYWPIGEEADDEAQAFPLAEGLFPDHPTSQDRKSTRLNSSHRSLSRMPSSA